MEGIVEGDSFNVATDAFLSWLRSTGATVSPLIRVADLRDRQAGRGVGACEFTPTVRIAFPYADGQTITVALDDIPEETELFSIPRAAILTAENSSTPPQCFEGLEDPWLRLILAMIFEHQKGAESRWAPYLDVLPTAFNTLMFWSDEELSHLQGSAVLNKISRNKADETFTQQVLPIIRQHAADFRADAALPDSELLSLCHRMGSTIMAYAFDLESSAPPDPPTNPEEEWEEDEDDSPGKGLVPLADLLNADADRNNAKLFYEADQVVMKAIRPIPAGAEVFNDYGALPSADLLRRYGYLTDNYARYDCVEIPAALLQTQAVSNAGLSRQEVDLRWAYLAEQGLAEDGFDILHTITDQEAADEENEPPISEELCVILNVLTLSKEDFGTHRRKDKLPKPDLSAKAQQLLRAVLVHRLADYRRDAELRDSSTNPSSSALATMRQNMAVHVVRGEKRVLHEALAALPAATQVGKKRPATTLEDEVEQIRKRTKK